MNRIKESVQVGIKRKLTMLTIGALAVTTLTACGSGSKSSDSSNAQAESGSSDSSTSSGTDYKTVRIGSPNSGDKKLLELGNLAVDKGYLEEELNAVGYTAEYIGFDQAGPAVNEAFASGDIDMAFYGNMPAVVAKSNDIDTTIIGIANSAQQYGIVTSKDSGIKEPKDLEGKKVIVGVGTNFQYFWTKFVEAENIDTSSIELVNNVSDAASIIQTGDADAYVALYYSAMYYKDMGIADVPMDSLDMQEATTQWVVAAKSDYIKDNSTVGVAINKALIRAQKAAIDKPEDLYNSLSNSTISADVIKEGYGFDETFAYLSPEITDDTYTKLSSLETYLYDNKLISKNVDVKSFIDNSYYKQAASELEDTK